MQKLKKVSTRISKDIGGTYVDQMACIIQDDSSKLFGHLGHIWVADEEKPFRVVTDFPQEKKN